MSRRQGFTIVELLVALALIIFIMLILTEAFSAGMETFRRLKAIGDMQERLRSTALILRRDLQADHFEARRRLSDLNFWNEGYPLAGFFCIPQNSGSVAEGTDPDLQTSGAYAGYTIAPVRANYPNQNPPFYPMLYFSAKLRGNGRGDVFSASVPPGSAVLALPTNSFNQPVDSQYQGEPGSNAFNSQWGEILYGLVPDGTSAGGTPLYSLYRFQFAVVPDNSNVNNQVQLGAALNQGSINGYYEMSCWPTLQNNPGPTYSLYFNSPRDLTDPTRRTAYYLLNPLNPNPPGNAAATLQVRGQFNRGNPGPWSATLLLSDVISFDVRALRYDLTNNQADPYFVDLTTASAFDTYDPRVLNPNSNQTAPTYVLKALQISIRIWELKTQQTRQITIVQDL
jgi:type II secretory pathway pseudopilin PulG